MKLFLRILLFSLSITIASLSHAADTTPVDLNANKSEILAREYVELESTSDESSVHTNFSIYTTVSTLIKIARQKTYSLLNWSFHIRNRTLEIPNYNRKEQFGRWINDPEDDTCFNTRAKVLQRDSARSVIFKDTNKCVVQSGLWNDPYTGNALQNAEEIQIDHLVALKNAYTSGAYKWNFKTRCLYANYMGLKTHLLSVDGIENMKKGDKGPENYMPPNPELACTYLKSWLTVKFLWSLRMTQSEAIAISKLMKDNRCNLNRFVITEKEILEQANYFSENIDLCQNVDPTNKVAP